MLNMPIIKYTGDAVKCSKWLGFAKAKLNALITSMDKAKLQQNRAMFYPVPGVKIIISKAFNITRISISVFEEVSYKELKRIYKWFWYTILSGGRTHYIMDVIADQNNDIWICGGYSTESYPTIDFGDNILLAKYDKDGDFLFARTLVAQTNFQFATSMDVSSDGFYISMDHYSSRDDSTYDSAILKFNNLGIVQWSKKIGLVNSNTYITDLQVTSDGIFTCGKISDRTQEPTKDDRYIGFVNKLDFDGSLVWSRFIYYDYSSGSVPDGHIWFEKLAIDSVGNSYCVGTDTGEQTIDSYFQWSVFKLNNEGILQWQKQIDSVILPYALDTMYVIYVDVDSQDNIYIMGLYSDVSTTTSGNLIYSLIKINPNGDLLWQRNVTIPYSSSEGNRENIESSATFFRITIDLNDNIYLLTYAYDLTGDSLLFKFSSAGDLLWQRSIEHVPYKINFARIEIDSDNNIIITGDSVLISIGGADPVRKAFTIKLPWTGIFIGKHNDMLFIETNVTVGNSGLAIRPADTGGLQVTSTSFYNSWAGTYETENLNLTGITSKILIKETF